MRQKVMRYLCAPLGAASIPALCLAEAPELEEVRVVGTHLRLADYSSPSPLFTIDADSLQRDASPSLGEYLNRLPQFAPAVGAATNNGNSRAQLDLRGLGSNRTLVMVDGRRLGPAGSDGVIDINTIPTAMVESVEVLTGGASAVYGSDAISGVVNVRMNRELEGVAVGGAYHLTDRGDGDLWDASISAGWQLADGRARLGGFYHRTEGDPVQTSARDFSRVPLVDSFTAAELEEGGSPVIPDGMTPLPGMIGGQPVPGITFTADGLPRALDFNADQYNYFDGYNYLQTGLQRDAVFGYFDFSFSDELDLAVDVAWTGLEKEHEFAPVPGVLNPARINTDNPLLTPEAAQALSASYDPAGSGIATTVFGYRFLPLGGRTREYDSDSWRLTASLAGQLAADWSWEAAYTYNDHEGEQTLGGYASASRFQQSLLVDPDSGQCMDPSGGCVPGDYFGRGRLSAAARDFVAVRPISNRQDSNQQVAEALLRGGLPLWGEQQLQLATGASWRRDESRLDNDPLWLSGDVIGGGGRFSELEGSFEVSELFVEGLLPLLSNLPLVYDLQLEAGVRLSDYTTIGTVDSWKAGLNWRLTESLRLRAMSQRAVRAPNVQELYYPVSVAIADSALYGYGADPCSASVDPVGSGLAATCLAQGMPEELLGSFEANPFYPTQVYAGGNPELDAEEADTFTLGLAWQRGGFAVALDYYDIDIDNAIAFISQASLESSCYGRANPNSEYCLALQRDASGHVARVDESFRNAAQIVARGFDLQLEWVLELPALWRRPSSLRLALIGNHVREYAMQADPASALRDCSGYFGFPCDFTDGQGSAAAAPEYRTVTSLAWRLDAATLELVWRWIDGVDNGFAISGLPFLEQRELATAHIDSQDYFDLNFDWQGAAGWSLVAGVKNLADEDPPLLGSNSVENNTNPQLYDVLGRRYHLGLAYRW